MGEPILISKLLDLSPTAVVKSTSSTIKGLLVLGAIAGLGWAVYAGVVRPVTKPNPTTKQEAETINNYYPLKETEKFFLGVKILGFRIGIVR